MIKGAKSAGREEQVIASFEMTSANQDIRSAADASIENDQPFVFGGVEWMATKIEIRNFNFIYVHGVPCATMAQ
jgi:hypothetical protein